MKHYFQLHFITNCNWLNRPKELWYCSTPNTSHTVFFTIAHVTAATQDSRSLANKDTLHNRDSKGMSVYMESEYSYLQEGFLSITILSFHFKQNTKYICTMFTSRSTSTVMKIIQRRSLCLYWGKYLHFSINTKVLCRELGLENGNDGVKAQQQFVSTISV